MSYLIAIINWGKNEMKNGVEFYDKFNQIEYASI